MVLKDREILYDEDAILADRIISVIELRKRWITVKFPWDYTIYAKVSSLPVRQWDKANKVWKIPCELSSINLLLDYLKDFPISGSFVKLYEELLTKEAKLATQKEKLANTQNNLSTKLNIDLKLALFPFQKAGVSAINVADGKVLLADEQGIGKTCQAIAYCHQHNLKTLVVCPAFLRYVWDGEIKKFTNRSVKLLDKENVKNQTDFTVVSYTSLKKYTKELLKQNFDCVILDEATHIKNPRAARTKETHKLKTIDKRLVLTGTPALNRPAELFSLLNFIDKDKWSSFWEFAAKYCDLKLVEFDKKDGSHVKFWDYNGASNLKELHEELSTVMIRRKKEDVLPDLPEKLISDIYLDLPPEGIKEYNQAYDDFIGYLKEQGKLPSDERDSTAIHLTKLTTLKQILSNYKLEFVEEFIEELGDSKALIFSQYLAPLYALQKQYKDSSVTITGKDSDKIRDMRVRQFQNDERIRLFLGSIKASGMGITLTAADKVLFINLLWTPADHDQAMDRCHRIGSKNCINAYFPVFRGTIEEDILEILNEKRKVISQILGEEDNRKLRKDVYKKFISKVKKREKITE